MLPMRRCCLCWPWRLSAKHCRTAGLGALRSSSELVRWRACLRIRVFYCARGAEEGGTVGDGNAALHMMC